MNLYLIQRYSESALMINANPSQWVALGETQETIYFEPSEEAEVLRGTCIMIGSPVRFVEIANRQFYKELGERCYVLAHHEPEIVKLSSTLRIVKLQTSSIFDRTHTLPQR